MGASYPGVGGVGWGMLYTTRLGSWEGSCRSALALGWLALVSAGCGGQTTGGTPDASHTGDAGQGSETETPEASAGETGSDAMVVDCDAFDCTCLADSTCSDDCSAAGCQATCAAGATCSFTCEGSPGVGGHCIFTCPAQSSCTNSCPGGFCDFQCAAGSTCVNTCAGGYCAFNCASGANCTNTCGSAGGCQSM